MYKVVTKFIDLEDNSHLYNVGDEYPRVGLKPTKKRIKELSSVKNKRNTILIELLSDDIDKKTDLEALEENTQVDESEDNEFDFEIPEEIEQEQTKVD